MHTCAYTKQRENRIECLIRGSRIAATHRATSILDNPFYYGHSQDVAIQKLDKRLEFTPCSDFIKFNIQAAFRNRASRFYLCPLKRTMPWLMGASYKMGDLPQMTTYGGIFPRSIPELVELTDEQLNKLEDFYSRRFWQPRIDSFWDFITKTDVNLCPTYLEPEEAMFAADIVANK